LETVSCALCGSYDSTILLSIGDQRYHTSAEIFDLSQCTNCGLIYINPRPKEDELGKYYPINYYCNLSKFAKIYLELLNMLKIRKIKKFETDGKILDIGCGDGTFLTSMKKARWETYGIDISEDATKLSIGKLGENIFNCSLHHCQFAPRFFDVITLNNVLEHLANPNEELAEIHRILKDDGILMISVPNIDSMQYTYCREHWIHLDIPRHLFHYSPNTICQMLRKNNFVSVEITYPLFEYPLDIYHSINKKRSKCGSNFLALASLLIKIWPQGRGTMQIICKKDRIDSRRV
jgi:SAM-dependent methyltransferase